MNSVTTERSSSDLHVYMQRDKIYRYRGLSSAETVF